jgi:CTP synthase
MNKSFLFVVGGVMSGVGKGTSTAALALTLQAKGKKVTAIKIDPYVNVDAGTMNPVEHGEVFVTTDGDETDQDIGTYERYLGQDITSLNYMTTGRVYRSVIEKERNLEYGGKCVEVVPHVPEEVINRIEKAAEKSGAEIVLIEIGGTIGEYQNVLFLEAARMMQAKYPGRVGIVLVSYLPVPPSIGEMKTKPTQYAVRTLNSAGLLPNFIVCRSSQKMDEPRKEKLAQFCAVPKDHIIGAQDAKSVYDIPDMFEEQDFANKVLRYFGQSPVQSNLSEWHEFVAKLKNAATEVKVAVLGKYFSTGDFVLGDVYISVIEAIKHAASTNEVKVKIDWLNSEDFEKNPDSIADLGNYDGVIIPGGFGSRGIEGKINAIKYLRINKIPYLGLCYGMQCAVIEFARNVAGINDATSQEMNPETNSPVIHLQSSQEGIEETKNYGGTMRLGSYDCILKPETFSAKAYGTIEISERHRHRYEFNNEYRQKLEESGLIIAGTSPDNHFVEIVEIKDHPFFVGVQFHPEFQSRPLNPHPLFVDFIKATKLKGNT